MRSMSQLVPSALRHVLRNGPISDGKVTFAWRTVVGPALERVTSVKLENGVLMVDAGSAHWSKEITRSSSVILARLQDFLGQGVITRIVVRHPRA